VVEQAARSPSSRGRARELLRNSLRWFSDPVRNEAAWPPLRCGQTARSADLPWGQKPRGAKRGFGGQKAIEGSGALAIANRQVRCRIKKGSTVEP
jgi:hypothetical protein